MYWLWRVAVSVSVASILGGFYNYWGRTQSPIAYTVWEVVYRLPVPYWAQYVAHHAITYCLPVALASVSMFALLTRYCSGSSIPDNLRCRKCGYALIGLSEPRCPECGEPI